MSLTELGNCVEIFRAKIIDMKRHYDRTNELIDMLNEQQDVIAQAMENMNDTMDLILEFSGLKVPEEIRSGVGCSTDSTPEDFRLPMPDKVEVSELSENTESYDESKDRAEIMGGGK